MLHMHSLCRGQHEADSLQFLANHLVIEAYTHLCDYVMPVRGQAGLPIQEACPCATLHGRIFAASSLVPNASGAPALRRFPHRHVHDLGSRDFHSFDVYRRLAHERIVSSWPTQA